MKDEDVVEVRLADVNASWYVPGDETRKSLNVAMPLIA
jgi:hypothetical protein